MIKTSLKRCALAVLLISSWIEPDIGVARVPQSGATSAPVVIPFEFVTRHIMIKVSINDSAPLSFILDTGDKVAVVDSGKARALGLNLQGEVNVGGAGAGRLKGSFVRNATLKVIGLEGNPQPVALAIPLDGLESKMGHDIDGIIGTDFIKQFVMEVDFEARVLRLHDRDKFTYSGSGEIVPTRLNGGGHPVISAEVGIAGREPLQAKFVVDLGSGGSLILHTPFVEQQRLPLADQKTIRAIGGGGAGGKTTGRLGRVTSLRIGRFQIDNPLTMFSEDKAGAFNNSEIQGNIGEQIVTKFKLYLDFAHDRMILEPNSSFKEPLGRAFAGIKVVAEGSDYKTFRIDELLEDSPATEAGLQTNDVLLQVDGQSAAQLTLSSVVERLEKPVPHNLSVRRGDKVLQITVTPRKMV
jgi:hypothetical protein